MRPWPRLLRILALLFVLVVPAAAWASCEDIGSSKPLTIKVGNALGASERQLNSGSYALVIGASAYDGITWPKLQDVAFERQAVAAQLARQGFLVRQVCDPVKGPAGALAEIRQFIAQYGVGDNRLVIYLGGHGWAEPDLRKGYFAMVNSPAPGPMAREYGFSSFDMVAAADRFRGRHLLIVVNSCYSATLFTRQGQAAYPPVSVIDYEALQRPSRRFITAGEAGAETPTPSPFAAAFVLGIAGFADLNNDGLVRGAELAVWLRDTVTRARTPSVPMDGAIPNPANPQAGDTIGANDLSSGDIVFRYDPNQKVVARNDIGSNGDNALAAALLLPEDLATRAVPAVRSSLPDDFFVFFFEKDADRSAVTRALDAVLIPVTMKRSVLPATGRINGIACHPQAPVEAVRAVARALIAAGVELRIIDQATVKLEERRKVIQVLEFKRVVPARRPDLRPLVLADLDELKGCPNDFVKQRRG